MTRFLRHNRITKALAAPSVFMQGIISQEIEQSNDSKLLVDTNGNAVLNMKNEQVNHSMRQRMLELAAKNR